MIDIMAARRETLVCRGFQHPWDHGPAPIQVDDTQKPLVWVTRGHCTSCGMKRWRYLVPGSCAPLGPWEYQDITGMRPELHLVTQLDARVEIARRDQIGAEAPMGVASIAKKRRRKTG